MADVKRDGVLRICHLTSVHPRYDTRVFVKMCSSVAELGHEVTLVVADGRGDEVRSGVRIRDVGASLSRSDRMRNAPWKVLAAALEVDSDVFHMHDPELLQIGGRLKSAGKRVVFDSHEDVPKQILGKHYLSKPVALVLSKVFGVFETFACRRLDGVIAATPTIRDKFKKHHSNVIDINNFPLLQELDSGGGWSGKKDEICYVGGISRLRGIDVAVEAMQYLRSGARFNLGGKFIDPDLERTIKTLPGWDRVNDLGFLDRAGVREVLGRSVAGLVTLLPAPNHVDSQPNKMFEYMSAGIPVIASNFPLLREFVEGNDCGLCVDPHDPRAVAAAIDELVFDQGKARRMGENGRKAVVERYNWEVEEKKLLGFYQQIIDRKPV